MKLITSMEHSSLVRTSRSCTQKLPVLLNQATITLFKRICHSTLSWAIWVQETPSHVMYFRTILILPAYLRLHLPNGLFYLGFFPHGATTPSGPGPPHCWDLAITCTRRIFDRTPMDGWSARRTGLYLTTHNTYKRQTSMSLAGSEPAITDRSATRIRSI
jgi:hypothetical protein